MGNKFDVYENPEIYTLFGGHGNVGRSGLLCQACSCYGGA